MDGELLLRELIAGEKINTTRIGEFCPYWTAIDGTVLVADSAEDLFDALPQNRRVIDPVAVLELLQFNYMLGNRTLIQGVQRMPWRAELSSDGTIARKPPIAHDERLLDTTEAASRLGELLSQELDGVLHNRKRVFLLLTGGLDSRVIAGILKKIESNHQSEIICTTWGMPNSRDVCYARRIASWYGWEFVNIRYDANLTWANIERGATWGGSEVAGIHLHGMDWFRTADPTDLVLAASFGDSVGRAEFSSVHLSKLALRPIGNSWGLIHPSIAPAAIAQAESDRELAWENAEGAAKLVRHELDMQENYMRRMICHAMDYIRQYCSLHQAFTSEALVSFMWSLSPNIRNDEIYYELLKGLDTRLYSLPWARTGIAPDGTAETDPALREKYHEWGKWLRHDLRGRLEPLVFSSGLGDLGLFYTPAIRRMWNGFLSEPDEVLWTGETAVKLASIELSRRRFGLQPCRKPTHYKDAYIDIKKRAVRKAARIWHLAIRRKV